MQDTIVQVVLMIIPLIFAVIIHEVTHGFVAYKLGDNTAKNAGRLTLNPVKHMDFIGSFILPLVLKLTGSPVLFGYAKPVPVNFQHLRNFKTGVIIVAAAGAVSNLILALVSGILYQVIYNFSGPDTGYIAQKMMILLSYSVIINSVLALFNLIPLPPLDGSKIMFVLLPAKYRVQYVSIEKFGMFIIIILIFTGVLGKLMKFFVEPLVRLFLGY